MEPSADRTSIDVIASALEPLAPAVGWLSSPDGALTLMLSDVADAASIEAQLGPARSEQLLSDRHLLVERLVAHHDGQVVKFERDGFLASFNGAHGGLHAALELQRTFGDTNGADPAPALGLRIGLHSGFVIAGSDELLSGTSSSRRESPRTPRPARSSYPRRSSNTRKATRASGSSLGANITSRASSASTASTAFRGSSRARP